MANRIFSAALVAAAVATGAVASPALSHAQEPFGLLQPGDAPQVDCGTYLVTPGEDPGLQNLRAFMSTEQVLYVRTGGQLRMLELVRVEQQSRDPAVLGEGDRLELYFENSAGEQAELLGTVTVSAIDDDGSYAAIELESTLHYRDQAGLELAQKLQAFDMCL